jgi:hypothetical protein
MRETRAAFKIVSPMRAVIRLPLTTNSHLVDMGHFFLRPFAFKPLMPDMQKQKLCAGNRCSDIDQVGQMTNSQRCT